MAVGIAELFVSVGADVSGAVAGLTALGVQLEGTAAKFQQAAPAALLLEGAAVGVGAALGGSVKVAASFEQAMADVRAVMTPSEIQQFGDALDKLAINLGQQTVFSARESAAAIGELVRAGVPAEAVLGGAAKAALDLASATGVAPAAAATIAAQAMNAFHKSVADLPNVVDTLAGTVNATAANMTDLQQGLAVTATTANQMGLSFNDTSAAIGLFVNAGETGATAGTGMRQMLLELIPTTKPAQTEMKALGLITKDGSNAFFDAHGNIKSLADISQVLQNSLKGMSNEQKIAALNTLFTRDAINSAKLLAEQGATGINKLTGEIAKVSAADVAAERLNTLTGSLNNMFSSIETVQITIGKVFLPEIRLIADAVRGAVDSFSNLSPEMQKAISVLVAIAGAVAGVVGTFVLLAPFISALPTAFAALGSVLVAVAPLFLGLAGVAALLFAVWQVNLFGIRDLVASAFEHLPDVLATITTAFSNAGDLWTNSVLPALQTIANAIEQRVIPVFNAISAGPLGALGLVFQKVFAGDIAGAVDTFQAIIGAIAPGIGALVVNIRSALGNFFDTFGPIIGNLGFVLQKVFAGDFAGAADTFRAILGALSPELGKFITAAVDLAGVVGPILGNAFASVGEFLSTEVVPRLRDLATNVIPFLQDASAALGLFWETRLGPALQAVGGFIATEVGPRLQTFADNALPAIITASAAVVNFWDTRLGPAAENIGNFIAQNVGPAFETVGSAMQTIAARGKDVLDFFGPLTDQLGKLATNIGGGIVDFFQTQLPAAFKSFGEQAASLGPLFSALAGFLGAVFNVMGSLANLGGTALQGLFENVLIPGFQKLGDVLAPMQPVFSSVGGSITSVANGIGLIGDRLGPVTQFFIDAKKALDDFALAIQNADKNLPDWLKPKAGGALPGGPQVQPASFNPAGGLAGGAGGGNVIITGPVSIGSEVDADSFLQRMADLVSASTKRVNAPPDNSGFPALSTV